MNKHICTEIAEFEVISRITDEEFIRIVEELEEKYHSIQKSFINTELIKDNDQCKWIMIQHWESIDESREASKMMMKTPITESFRQALNPRTIKIRYFTHIKKWNKNY